MRELEQIVGQMERGEVTLEESISRYQRGADLVNQCRAVLSQAQQLIERISAKSLAADARPTSDEPTH